MKKMKKYSVSGYAANYPVYTLGTSKTDAAKKWNKRWSRGSTMKIKANDLYLV